MNVWVSCTVEYVEHVYICSYSIIIIIIIIIIARILLISS